MFSKIVFLFSITTVLAYHIQNTPEDLRDIFQEVDTQVKGLQHETMIAIRTYVIPLAMYVDDAKTYFMGNLTEAAKPYWANIRALEESAKEQGQDISKCIDLGNNQIYTLNNTVVNEANEKFNYYSKSGNDALDAADSEAYSVIQELIALEQVVATCNDDVCATDLSKIVTQYYARAKQALIDAETKARNYVLVYLPVLLEANKLDATTYVAKYTVFLGDVTDCINKL